jgi:LacI family transcriptional regulator
MPRDSDNFRIGVLSPVLGFSERVAAGALDYARQAGGHLTVQGWPIDTELTQLRRELARVDGVVAALTSPNLYRFALSLGIPVVNVSASRPARRTSRVHMDNVRIGRLAAEHLLASGFSRFAYLGAAGCWYAHLRAKGFRDTLGDAGHSCAIAWQYWDPGGVRTVRQGRRRFSSVRTWVRHLAKPTAIMGSTDDQALVILEAADALGLAVSEQVGVIGVDNHATRCELASPPLSSVELGPERVGAAACRILDDVLLGRYSGPREVFLPPVAVIARQSTDPVSADNPTVASALRYIRRHAGEPLQVSDVAEAIGVNRRNLERAFASHVRQSPYAVIVREHVELAKRLLATTDMPIGRIAPRCGFVYPHHFSMVFRREEGVSPREYRARLQQ